ncbi:MAG: gliding motility-associated C-terminal domain-containing protein [Bacteroidaceae bacterium]|nr:gliding motility-associated C-terminal domain-containing protein [Bacteroidaceae bacterium]
MNLYKPLFSIVFLFFILFIAPFSLVAQQVNPLAIVETENGVASEETFQSGESFSGSAPMRIRFEAGLQDVPAGMSSHCDWQFYMDPVESSFLNRYEEETTFNFDVSGTYRVVLTVTFTDEDGTQTIVGPSDPLTITVATSKLHVPNAFSPNGDGINDIFTVTYQSLVKFQAVVFNRWGKEMYQWDLSTIDKGWDGFYHGKAVADGVYFIVVEAVGSDGVKYSHKGDINVLKGFTDSSTTP